MEIRCLLPTDSRVHCGNVQGQGELLFDTRHEFRQAISLGHRGVPADCLLAQASIRDLPYDRTAAVLHLKRDQDHLGRARLIF
jgi:hypothetical protein